MEVAPPRIVAAYHYGKRIVKAERRQPLELPALLIFRAHLSKHARGVGRWRQLQDGRQRGSGVLRVNVDLPVDERLVREQRAAEVQLALDLLPQPPLELLGDDLAEHELFGKILRPDHDEPRA